MSTFLELVNDVLRRTGQEAITTVAGAETPARQAMDFINDIYAEILQAAKCNFLEATGTIATSNGVALYSLAADADVGFLMVDRIRELSSQTRLWPMEPSSIPPAALTDTGRPTGFWIEGTKLRLYPIPNASYTIEYMYLKRPAKLINNSDNSLIPLAWERLLVRGAASLLEKFLGEMENSRMSYGLYLEGLALLKARHPLRSYSFQKAFYRSYTGR